MATQCLIPLLGKMLRVTELDSCGAPLEPDGEFIATDGFVSITLSSEVEDGTEIIVRKANGSLCVNEKQADSFKRFTVELHLCGVNPSLLGIMSNAEPYYDDAAGTGDVIGFTVPEGSIEKWFSLELWTGLSGGACEPGAESASGYILLPFVTAGVLGDLEINGENAIDFSITGAATRGGNQWGVGPYDDVTTGGALPVPLDPFDHLLMISTAIAPPPSSCDPQPIPTAGTLFLATAAPLNDVTDTTTNPVVSITGGGLTSGQRYHLEDEDGNKYETDASLAGPGGTAAEARVAAPEGMKAGTYTLSTSDGEAVLADALTIPESGTDGGDTPTVDVAITSPTDGSTVGTLEPITGTAPAGTEVTLQYLKSARWTTMSTTTAAADDTFTFDGDTPMSTGAVSLRVTAGTAKSETVAITVED